MIWTETTNGKKMPVDAEPVKTGNIFLEDRHRDAPIAHVIGRATEREQYAKEDALYRSHFVSCPFSKDFRKG